MYMTVGAYSGPHLLPLEKLAHYITLRVSLYPYLFKETLASVCVLCECVCDRHRPLGATVMWSSLRWSNICLSCPVCSFWLCLPPPSLSALYVFHFLSLWTLKSPPCLTHFNITLLSFLVSLCLPLFHLLANSDTHTHAHTHERTCVCVLDKQQTFTLPVYSCALVVWQTGRRNNETVWGKLLINLFACFYSLKIVGLFFKHHMLHCMFCMLQICNSSLDHITANPNCKATVINIFNKKCD